MVSRGSLIRQEGRWSVDALLKEFKKVTERFIASYFSKDADPVKRIVDYQEMLETMERFLRDLKRKR